jgi:hypothetical protein
MKSQRLLLILLFAFVLVGCGTNGTSSSTSFTTLKPTALHASRPERKDYDIPALDRTVHNAAVQRLFVAAYKLPTPPSGTVNCPADIGLVYQLVFLQGATPIQHMSLQATGCQYLFLTQSDVRLSDYPFQVLLCKTIGIPSLTPGQSHP